MLDKQTAARFWCWTNLQLHFGVGQKNCSSILVLVQLDFGVGQTNCTSILVLDKKLQLDFGVGRKTAARFLCWTNKLQLHFGVGQKNYSSIFVLDKQTAVPFWCSTNKLHLHFVVGQTLLFSVVTSDGLISTGIRQENKTNTFVFCYTHTESYFYTVQMLSCSTKRIKWYLTQIRVLSA